MQQPNPQANIMKLRVCALPNCKNTSNTLFCYEHFCQLPIQLKIKCGKVTNKITKKDLIEEVKSFLKLPKPTT